jgi:tetratricopeptide (TPR) repeat protein
VIDQSQYRRRTTARTIAAGCLATLLAIAGSGCAPDRDDPRSRVGTRETATAAPHAAAASAELCGPPGPLPAGWPEGPPNFVNRLAVRRLLIDRRFDELRALLDAAGDSVRRDARLEHRVVDVYDAFAVADPALEPAIDAFIEAAPGSAAPWLVRATHRVGAGRAARGIRLSRETSRSQFRNMEEAFEAALQDLGRARELEPCHYVMYRNTLEIVGYVADGSVSRATLNEALVTYPASFRLRSQHLGKLKPRWGGSYRQMEAFIQEQLPAASLNPRIRWLQGFVAWDRAEVAAASDDIATALQEYDRAIAASDHPPIRVALAELQAYIGRLPEALQSLTVAIEGSPSYVEALRLRAKVRHLLAKTMNGSARDSALLAVAADLELANALDPADQETADLLRYYRSLRARR